MGAVILVLDDEPAVSRLIETQLKHAGHCVYATAAAAEAIRIAGLLGSELDILICDVFLKESSGIEVTRAIHPICPNARVILISGEFDQDNQTPFKIDDLHYLVLAKPFTATQLLGLIHHVINESDSTAPEEKVT